MSQHKEKEIRSKPKVAVALSGGAARGLAHIGVLKALLKHKIPIDFIAGTSAGALVGGALASGLTIEEIEEIGINIRWRDFGRMTISRLGIQTNIRLEEFIRTKFPVTRFEDLVIPLAVVATDLNSGAAVIMRDSGDVASAIRASCAIPGWYVPVMDNEGRLLVDGGLVANIPSTIARSFDADIVIAVDVNTEGAKFWGPPQSAIGVLLQSMMVLQRLSSGYQHREANIIIGPKIGHIRWDEMHRAKELIAAGEEAALEKIEEIAQLINPPLPDIPPKRRWYQFLIPHKIE
jgi:NTE family protein